MDANSHEMLRKLYALRGKNYVPSEQKPGFLTNTQQLNNSHPPFQTEPTTPQGMPLHPFQRMPSMGQMASNLLHTAKDVVGGVVRGEVVKLSEEEAQQRLSICNGCEFFVKDTSRCSKCGCYMAYKTYLKAASCPENKW